MIPVNSSDIAQPKERTKKPTMGWGSCGPGTARPRHSLGPPANCPGDRIGRAARPRKVSPFATRKARAHPPPNGFDPLARVAQGCAHGAVARPQRRASPPQAPAADSRVGLVIQRSLRLPQASVAMALWSGVHAVDVTLWRLCLFAVTDIERERRATPEFECSKV